MSNTQTRYDLESDCLVIKKKGTKIKESISLGNMTIDFDNQGRVTGLQLLNASKIMSFTKEVDNPEKVLQNIQTATLEQKWFEDGLFVKAQIHGDLDGEKQEAIINTNAPNISLA